MLDNDVQNQILAKVIANSERLACIETSLKVIEEHTSVMNQELGVCQDNIMRLESAMNDKGIRLSSYKKVIVVEAAIISGVITTIANLIWILHLIYG